MPGGRAGLIRIAAILGNSYLSFPIPDYSAYSEMLTLFRKVRRPKVRQGKSDVRSFLLTVLFSWQIAPIPMPLSEEDHYHVHPDKIAEEITRGSSVILTSNPRNPTGHFVSNSELSLIQDICRDRATLILDEFYGGYNYSTGCDGSTISGATNVTDVNKDGSLYLALPPLTPGGDSLLLWVFYRLLTKFLRASL